MILTEKEMFDTLSSLVITNNELNKLENIDDLSNFIDKYFKLNEIFKSHNYCTRKCYGISSNGYTHYTFFISFYNNDANRIIRLLDINYNNNNEVYSISPTDNDFSSTKYNYITSTTADNDKKLLIRTYVCLKIYMNLKTQLKLILDNIELCLDNKMISIYDLCCNMIDFKNAIYGTIKNFNFILKMYHNLNSIYYNYDTKLNKIKSDTYNFLNKEYHIVNSAFIDIIKCSIKSYVHRHLKRNEYTNRLKLIVSQLNYEIIKKTRSMKRCDFYNIGGI